MLFHANLNDCSAFFTTLTLYHQSAFGPLIKKFSTRRTFTEAKQSFPCIRLNGGAKFSFFAYIRLLCSLNIRMKQLYSGMRKQVCINAITLMCNLVFLEAQFSKKKHHCRTWNRMPNKQIMQGRSTFAFKNNDRDVFLRKANEVILLCR